MYLMGGNVYLVAEDELDFRDGRLYLRNGWTWPGMQIIRAHTNETYVAVDRDGLLQPIEEED